MSLNSTLPDPEPFPGSMELDKNNVVIDPTASPAGIAIKDKPSKLGQCNAKRHRWTSRMKMKCLLLFLPECSSNCRRPIARNSHKNNSSCSRKRQRGVVVEAGQATSEEENKMGEECAKHEVVSQAQEEEGDVVLIMQMTAKGGGFLQVPANSN
jgi:hypothetical protein